MGSRLTKSLYAAGAVDGFRRAALLVSFVAQACAVRRIEPESIYSSASNQFGSSMNPKATLLIVDDEPDVREVLEEYFVAHGYAAFGAESADAARAVAAEHAIDLALVDISKTATFTDYFVIATAQSPLQFNALTEYLEKELALEAVCLCHREGSPDSGWVLLDFGDIIVHLFSPEKRAYYRLEDLWGRTSQVVRFTG